MVDYYFDKKDLETAIFHGEMAIQYFKKPDLANNLGYLYLVKGNLSKAGDLFEVAIEAYDTPKEMSLPQYNLGIVELKKGNLKKSLDKFILARDLISECEKKDRKMGCLIIPKSSENEKKIEYQEIQDPDLLLSAQTAISVINEFFHDDGEKQVTKDKY